MTFAHDAHRDQGWARVVRRVAVLKGVPHLRLLIAIPVYNERGYVDRVLDKIKGFHPDILVVDDGSTDGTREILDARRDIEVIHHPVNRGYGQSLIDAFNYAGA